MCRGLTNSYRRAGAGSVRATRALQPRPVRPAGTRAVARGGIVTGSAAGARLRAVGNARGASPRPGYGVGR
jgi:hypothetical protein